MLDLLFRKWPVGLHARTARRARDKCEKPGNAGRAAAVFSHRMHHNLPDLDTANR